MYQAVRILGDAIREVHKRDAAYLKEFGIEFNANFILGGQIRGEGLGLFQPVFSRQLHRGDERDPYLQIGEARYGKPIIDRVIQPNTPLDEAAKCALISMDSSCGPTSLWACRSICWSTRTRACASRNSCRSTVRTST